MAGYESSTKTQAVKGDNLATMGPFLSALLDVAPTGEVSNTELRTAIRTTVCAHPDLNGTTQKNDAWADLRIDRIVMILYHLRRLMDPVKWQQMVITTQGQNV